MDTPVGNIMILWCNVSDEKHVYVVGCGPSLKGFDWGLLRHCTTIAVNGAVRDVPRPKYFITADSWFARKAAASRFWRTRAMKILVMGEDHNRWKRVRHIVEQFDMHIAPTRFHGDIVLPGEHGFCTGQNSGFCGMQMAVRMGASHIHLLGIDLTSQGGEHYHNRYGGPSEKRLNEFLVYFSEAVIILGKAGIKVLSHSSISRLNELIEYEKLERTNCHAADSCLALHQENRV